MILVVDDEPIILMGTVALIQSLGLDVISANTPDKAIAMLAEFDIDTLLTDFEMPGRNGVELARAALAVNPALNIIIATGRWKIEAELHPDWLVLPKPFTSDELAAALQHKT
jgi:CheY-like chemotaxis protein